MIVIDQQFSIDMNKNHQFYSFFSCILIG